MSVCLVRCSRVIRYFSEVRVSWFFCWKIMLVFSMVMVMVVFLVEENVSKCC